jgi:hypothetical protein
VVVVAATAEAVAAVVREEVAAEAVIAVAVAAVVEDSNPSALKGEKNKKSEPVNNSRCYNLKDQSIEKDKKVAFVRRPREAVL